MNYGIPFKRPFASPFGVPFLAGGTGGAGVTRPAPALFWSTAYSPDNFDLVTGANVNTWKGLEETTGTDLTQGTSGNQPTLVEDNTVTQFTASNQPTYAKDKQVTQDTLSAMPTYDETAGALDWNGSQWMDGLQPRTGNFSYRFIKPTLTSISSSLSSPTDGLTRFVIRSTDILVYSVSGTVYVFSNPVGFICDQVIVTFDGTNLRVFINNSESPTGTLNATGEEFLFTRLGRGSSSIAGTLEGFELYNEAIADPTNIVETPYLKLDGSDPSTMLSDSDVQPINGDSVRLWHDPSAENIMACSSGGNMSALPSVSGNFTIEIVGASNRFDQNNTIIGNESDIGRIVALQSGGTYAILQVSDSVGTSYYFSFQNPLVRDEKQTLKIILDGTTLSVYSSDELAGSQTTSGVFDFYKLGKLGPVYYDFYSYKQWNSADSSGEPDYTLTPDPTKMRTSANANPVLGEGIAKWYADEWSGYRDNHVLFDPVKYMEGLPTQAGDFTYIFKYQDDDQATAGAIVSSNIDASGLFNVDGDTTDLRAGDATNYLFDNTGATSYRMVAYLKSGDDVYNVTDYVTTPTQDATGKAFNLTSLGKATSGKDMKVKEFGLYDRELVGTDLDYFFYERDVNTGEIILVDGEPQLPANYNSLNYEDANWEKRYSFASGVESATIDATGWYFDAPNGGGSSQYFLDQFNDGTVSGDFEIILSTDQVQFTNSTSGASQRYFSLMLWDDTFADRYFTGFGRKIADESTGQTTHYFNDVTSVGGFDTSFAVDSTVPRTIGVKRIGTTLQFLLDGVVQRTETVTAFNNFSFRILVSTQNTAQYARGYVAAFEVKDGNGDPYYDGDGFPLSDYFRN